jgi:hypothetical protein
MPRQSISRSDGIPGTSTTLLMRAERSIEFIRNSR